MSRTMSGIPTSGAGDVKLDGDPNAFTGTNTYDVNRPTSTLTSTPAATDFLTKQNADTLYTGAAGDVLEGGNNVFTGTNTFNTNRPTSTLTSTIAATDLITKQNADTLYTNNTGDAVLAGANAFTGTNTFNTYRPTSTLTSTIAATDFITKQNADTLYTNNTGDAVLAGANAFTGTNTFNTNRPTSTIATTPAATDLITKQNADTLYTNNTGDALLAGGTSGSRQIFSGFNTFTNDLTMSGAVGIGNRADIDMLGDKGFIKQSATIQNKLLQNGASNEIDQNGTNNIISQSGLNALITTSGKMTCATAPTSGSDLCNKTYVDSQLRKTGFGQNFASNPIISYAVTGGNPTSSSGGDNKNGRMDSPVSGLNADVTISVVTGAIGETGNIKVDYCVVGEWSADGWDKGLIVARAEQQADGTFPYSVLFRSQTDASYPSTGRSLSTFLIGYQRNADSTMEQAIGFFIDDTAIAGKTYRYTPVLVSYAVNNAVHTFRLNRVVNNTNILYFERAVSCITATNLNV